jgi:serine protease Do
MKRLILIVTCLSLGALGALVGHSLLIGQSVPAGSGGVLAKETNSYRDVVKRVLPAVVSVEARAKGGALKLRRPGDMQLPKGGTEDSDPSRVGFGSGFLISAKGVIVTNNHVVENADDVIVTMADGRKLVTRNIRTDPKTDLAILQFDDKDGLPFLSFGDSNGMEIGDRVLAVGAPFGLTGTVTHGIISSKDRSLRMNMYEDFLQTDAAINPGNSGGPLVNLEGKVIGINSAIKSRTGGFQGIGLAISSNLGKTIVEQLLKEGVVRRGYLGVAVQNLDEDFLKELNLKDVIGVVVTRLYPDAPGEKGGLKSGDVITSIDEKKIKDTRELQTLIAGTSIGKSVEVRILRDRKPETLKITIEEQPKDVTVAKATPTIPDVGSGAIRMDKIGVTLADLTPALAEALGYPESVKGALITRMDRRGLASAMGLRTGLVIVSVERKPVTSAKTASAMINAGSTRRGIMLGIRGPGGSQTIILKEGDE